MIGNAPSAQRAAVFLDRDGVLIAAEVRRGRPFPPASVDDVRVLPGVIEACEELRVAGFLLIVATNQPDIARGTADPAVVQAINEALRHEVLVDEVLVCAHDDDDHCPCRKPAPGMLLDAASRWDIDLRTSAMVGDRWRDVEAGRRAGCRTVFVDRHYDEQQPELPDLTVPDLPAAVPWIVAMNHLGAKHDAQ